MPLIPGSLAKAGKLTGSCVIHQPHVRRLSALADVWLRAFNRRSALHEWALAHGRLYLLVIELIRHVVWRDIDPLDMSWCREFSLHTQCSIS